MRTIGRKQEYFVDLQGDITRSNADKIESQLLSILTNSDWHCTYLNMSNVDFIDSAGLGVLAKAYSIAKNQSRTLVFCHVKPSVKLVFEITGLDKLLLQNAKPL